MEQERRNKSLVGGVLFRKNLSGGKKNQIFFRVVIIGPMKKLNSQSPGCKAKAVTAILLLKTNQLCVSIKLRP
jgi:hypothetical protein